MSEPGTLCGFSGSGDGLLREERAFDARADTRAPNEQDNGQSRGGRDASVVELDQDHRGEREGGSGNQAEDRQHEPPDDSESLEDADDRTEEPGEFFVDHVGGLERVVSHHGVAPPFRFPSYSGRGYNSSKFPAMRPTTLCLLLKEGEVLLAMKKRRFGAGRWNGVGGKLEPGESLEAAALRETEEEIGVKIPPGKLEKVGVLKFFWPEDKKDWEQEVHIFTAREWDGEPVESEEMKPQWFKHENIPFSEMWPDDSHWLPLVLEGKKIEGEFYFSDEGNTFEKLEMREI